MSLFPADSELLREAKSAHAVDYAEIDALGHPPHLGGDKHRRDRENLRSCPGMNILAAAKGLDKNGVLGIVSQNPQIDLGVISREENVFFGWDKRLPYAVAVFRTNGDVL